MKRLLALLVALLMMLSCAAFAEPSTALTVAVLDPIIYANGETMLDMTGLGVELSAIVSDAGVFGLDAGAYVGEEYENTAAHAIAQLDANGLTFTAEGLSNIYSIDLAQYLNGFDVTTLLPSIPAHTLLSTPIEMEAVSIDLSQPVRYALIAELLTAYTTDGVIAIDRTAGELMINNLLTMIETAASSVDVEGIAELREARPAFDLNGTVTVEGDPSSGAGVVTITGEGNLYAGDSEDSVPFTLNYTDSADAVDLTVDVTEGSDVLNIALNSDVTPTADGRDSVLTTLNIGTSGEDNVIATYSSTPAEGSAQMDYVASLEIPSEQQSLTFLLSTGTNGDDIGFAIDVFAETPEDGSTSLYLYYAGEKVVDEVSTALNGAVSFGVDAGGESYAIDTYLLLQSAVDDTANWAYDSSAPIAIETISETDLSTLQAGLMGIAGTALTLINENVPGLAPLLSSLMG